MSLMAEAAPWSRLVEGCRRMCVRSRPATYL